MPAVKPKPVFRMVGPVTIIIVLTIIISACSPKAAANTKGLKMAPESMLPEEMQNAPVSVRESYQFAVANPDVLKQIPCYCGCGSMGHTSNYSCYIQGEQDGALKFEAHALGCGICVDITQDTMRMVREGKAVEAIRAAIDAKFAQYGPSNMP